MDEIKNADNVVAPAATTEAAPSQDPIKNELQRVQNTKRSKKEKLLFTKARVEKQLEELDGEEDDTDKPVTVGMLNEIKRGEAIQTALSIAEEVENENERELIKYHLTETIKSSGDPQKDFKTALSLVNSLKNSQIATEVARKTSPSGHVSSPGAPARTEVAFEPTADEAVFMRPPYNLTKEEIIAKRPKE